MTGDSIADPEHVRSVVLAQLVRRAKQRSRTAAQTFPVDIAVVDKADELDAAARCVDRLDHIEHLATEAAGADDDEPAGRRRLDHLPPTVRPVTARGHWALGMCKRAFDVAFAGAGLVVLSPAVAVLWVLVRFSLGTPVLHRQQRAGIGGRPIVVSKFRTMTDDTSADGTLLPDEQRLTGFGRRLRSASLDELPQLWSVLKGDMSLIGPRPLPLAYVDRYSIEQRRRLEVKPGITGWAQVNGRNALSWPEKLALDVWYVDNASLGLDVTVIWRTIGSVLRRQGVSFGDHATMPEFMGES
jgi:sugar transferase EpsL